MKTSELIGAHLDYWVARAEGIPAEQLTIRRVQRSTDTHCVRHWQPYRCAQTEVLRYSTNWAQGGPLIEKHVHMLHHFDLEEKGWLASAGLPRVGKAQADTALVAICRAVVRSVFGDEVPNE